jgi:hypothetical protein
MGQLREGGTEAERTSEPNGYTKTIKSFVSVGVNPSSAPCIDYLGTWPAKRVLNR